MFTSIKRITKYGWSNFKRQKGFNVGVVLILTMTLVFGMSFFLFQGATQFLFSSLHEKVDISVYFGQESTEQEILKIKKDISEIPEVKSIEYVSREKAMEKFTERHQQDSILMESLGEVGGNPFLASLNIKAWNTGQYASISNFLSSNFSEEKINKIDYFQRKPVIEKIFLLTSNVNKAGMVLGVVFALVAFFLVFNQIRSSIYDSRREIKTMRLVGASNLFIRGPFLAQAIISGFLSVVISVLLVALFCFFASMKIEMLIPGFDIFNYFIANLLVIFFASFVFGIGVSAFSSIIATRKYLKI